MLILGTTDRLGTHILHPIHIKRCPSVPSNRTKGHRCYLQHHEDLKQSCRHIDTIMQTTTTPFHTRARSLESLYLEPSLYTSCIIGIFSILVRRYIDVLVFTRPIWVYVVFVNIGIVWLVISFHEFFVAAFWKGGVSSLVSWTDDSKFSGFHLCIIRISMLIN